MMRDAPKSLLCYACSHAGIDSTFAGGRFICATLVVMQEWIEKR
jgi:hypothetical protein